jgi:hypothetical protein
MEYCIYGLVDPRDNQLKYIGLSKSVMSRYYKHCNSLTENNKKSNWVKSLKNKSLKPELLIIDECSGDEVEYLEQFYIAYYKSLGCLLTNGNSGGFRPKMSAEVIEKIRRGNTGKKRSPEAIEKYKKRRLTEEAKTKLAEFNRGRKISDEAKKKMSIAAKGKIISEETRKKMSIASSNRVVSEETRKKLSDRHKGRIGTRLGMKNSDEQNRNISKGNTGKKRTDTQRELISKMTKLNMPNKQTIKMSSLDGVFIKEYDSLRECCLENNFVIGTFYYHIVTKKRKEYKEYIFEL